MWRLSPLSTAHRILAQWWRRLRGVMRSRGSQTPTLLASLWSVHLEQWSDTMWHMTLESSDWSLVQELTTQQFEPCFRALLRETQLLRTVASLALPADLASSLEAKVRRSFHSEPASH